MSAAPRCNSRMAARRLLALLFVVMAMMPVMAQKNLYKFKVTNGAGKTIKLKKFRGKVLLIVNTATRCGFTPQYEWLEELYQKYRGQGFEILDFPCNQFGYQAPGTYRDIHRQCVGRWGITFEQFQKVNVNGSHELPLYTWLKEQEGFKGFDTSTELGTYLDETFRKADPAYDKKPDIKWNFTKFLIDQEGRCVDRFEPTASKDDVEAGIRALLRMDE